MCLILHVLARDGLLSLDVRQERMNKERVLLGGTRDASRVWTRLSILPDWDIQPDRADNSLVFTNC